MDCVPVVTDSPIPKMTYTVVGIRDIILEMTPAGQNQGATVDRMAINGIGDVIFTERFMTSFLAIFGISKTTFNLFSPEEVIERIISLGKGENVRIALEHLDNGKYRALSAIRTTKPLVESFDLWELYQKLGITNSSISYSEGVVRSEHKPSMFGDAAMNIGGEDMVRRFVMDIPIDGWGTPSAYLQITRLICSNGMIGESPAFRSAVSLGDNKTIAKGGKIVDDAVPTLRKFIEAHNNEEGFHIMSARMKHAAETPASLEEFYKLQKVLLRDDMRNIHRQKSGKGETDVISALHHLIGPTFLKDNGLVSLDNISFKRRSLVPVDCSVQDLINLASEIATHRANPNQSRKISAFIGQMLSDENGFDLEGHPLDTDKKTDFYLTDPRDAHKDDDDKELN